MSRTSTPAAAPATAEAPTGPAAPGGHAAAPLSTEDVVALSPVVPVVVLHDVEHAVPLARALLAGGVPVIEITLRTEAGLEAIARVRREVPGTCVGAGTVTTPEMAEAAHQAGAQFVVTPGSPARLVDAVLGTGLALLAGASTLTEVMSLLDRGQRVMKFFPAEQSGGTAYLRALCGPLPEAVFCPTGGITASSAPEYLALPNVRCVGGSWLTPARLLAEGDWDGVTSLAAEAAALG